MKRIFTRPLLLLYAYNETDLSGSDEAQRLIDGDPLVAEEYAEMNREIQALDEFKAEPSEESIRRIHEFIAGQ